MLVDTYHSASQIGLPSVQSGTPGHEAFNDMLSVYTINRRDRPASPAVPRKRSRSHSLPLNSKKGISKVSDQEGACNGRLSSKALKLTKDDGVDNSTTHNEDALLFLDDELLFKEMSRVEHSLDSIHSQKPTSDDASLGKSRGSPGGEEIDDVLFCSILNTLIDVLDDYHDNKENPSTMAKPNQSHGWTEEDKRNPDSSCEEILQRSAQITSHSSPEGQGRLLNSSNAKLHSQPMPSIHATGYYSATRVAKTSEHLVARRSTEKDSGVPQSSTDGAFASPAITPMKNYIGLMDLYQINPSKPVIMKQRPNLTYHGQYPVNFHDLSCQFLEPKTFGLPSHNAMFHPHLQAGNLIDPSCMLSHPKKLGSSKLSRKSFAVRKRNGASPAPRTRKKCAVKDCNRRSRSWGMCKAHSSVTKCVVEGCIRQSQSNQLCIRHGGGKRCEVEGCSRAAQSKGRCKAHGGGVRCQIKGCVRSSQGGGLCRTHGGGPRCKVLGCSMIALPKHKTCLVHKETLTQSDSSCRSSNRNLPSGRLATANGFGTVTGTRKQSQVHQDTSNISHSSALSSAMDSTLEFLELA